MSGRASRATTLGTVNSGITKQSNNDDHPPSDGVRVPKQVRSRQTVERILVAADQEIDEQGFAGTTTTSIAKRAGVSVGALYRFFSDKETLAEALTQRYLDDVAADYLDAMSTVESRIQVVDMLDELVDIASRSQVNHPGYFRLTDDCARQDGGSPAKRTRIHLAEPIQKTLEEAGVDIPADDLRLVVLLFLETVRHTLAHAPREGIARERVISELKTMVLAYARVRLAA